MLRLRSPIARGFRVASYCGLADCSLSLALGLPLLHKAKHKHNPSSVAAVAPGRAF
jgi:hypothetical protein